MGQRIQYGLVAGKDAVVNDATRPNTMIEIRFPAPVACRLHMQSNMVPWTSKVGWHQIRRITSALSMVRRDSSP